jgi:hypothetical protein
MTMTLIATTIVGSGGAANITFSSIPQTYTDLYLVLAARSSRGGENQVKIEFNGSTSGYTSRSLYGSSGSTASNSTTSIWQNAMSDSSQTANTFGSGSFYILNYTGSTDKSVTMDSASENNGVAVYQFLTGGIWANSAAITSIVLSGLNGENFVQNTCASLYGITKGSGGATAS